MGDSRQRIGGRYEVVRLLGKGGMGTVYEAFDLETKRRVAVKQLSLHRSDGEANHRFAREILATARVSSRHVVAIHDAGTDDDTGEPFMVMDYLEGEDVGSLSERLGTLPVDVSLRMAAQVCDALIATHAQGIVHRDIKPSNLVLVAGARRIVKLLDFGIARVPSANEHGVTALTQTGAMIGSPLYMAPEQFRGARDLDHRADIWALGVVLYRLLSGAVPHTRDTVGDLLVAVCVEPAPPLRVRAPWVPPAVAALVHRSLAIDVDARTPTARAFRDELDLLLVGGTDIDDAMLVSFRPPASSEVRARHPVSMSGPTRADGAPTAARRSVLFGGLAAAIVIGGAGIAYREVRSSTDEAPFVSPPHSIRPPPAPGIDPAALDIDLTGGLIDTPGAAWWERVRSRCTADAYRSVLASAPADHSGTAFAIACAAFAGDFAQAREMLARTPARARAFVTHPVESYSRKLFARANDDETAMAFAELALEAQPRNQHLLWTAAITEVQRGKTDEGRRHLQQYVAEHGNPDEWTTRATAILEALDAPRGCTRMLRDGAGRAVRIPGCPPH